MRSPFGPSYFAGRKCVWLSTTSSRPFESKSVAIGWTMSGAAANNSTTSRGSAETGGPSAFGGAGFLSSAWTVSPARATERKARLRRVTKSAPGSCTGEINLFAAASHARRGRTSRMRAAPTRAIPAETLKARASDIPWSRIRPMMTVAPAPTLMLTRFIKP